jgi:ABC-type Fe3+/spermidine/putrescine transport system ATPase subunit
MLKLERVCMRYGGVDAVVDFNLEVAAGEFMFLLGPSGSGKTTTLRMIAGFARPSGGRIELEGRPIVDVPPHRRDIGMVFQRYALFPHLSVAENVEFGLRMRGMAARERPRRVAEVLELVRLKGFDARFPHQLSGGQQQRVALARALAYHPALLLLDEPLANLDRRLRDEMRIELKRIQQEMGTTMLFVTHDQEEALTLGDRIAVMNEGRLEQLGSPVDIYRAPASRFVASFIGDMNFLAAEVLGPSVCGANSNARLACGGEHQIAGRHAAGRRVVACVRPERVALRAPGEGGIPGTVKYAGFSGDSIRYVALLQDGTEVLSRVPAQQSPVLFRVGDAVGVSWAEPVFNSFDESVH